LLDSDRESYLQSKWAMHKACLNRSYEVLARERRQTEESQYKEQEKCLYGPELIEDRN